MTANSLPRERHGHRGNGPTLNVYATHFHRYRHLWDSLAATDSNAWYFSDGSASESELRQRGTALAFRIRYAIDIGKRHRVLELGCGPARIGLPMANECLAWYGCDVSARMISIGQRRTRDATNVHLALLKENSLSIYETDYFDRAYSVGVFCHLHKEDVFRYLCEVYRVLKPGGVFSCGMWNICAEGGWKLWCNYVRTDDGVIPHTWTTPNEFECLLSGAGLKVQALLSNSKYLVEAVVSKGRSRAHLRPSHLTDDESVFVD
jgi:SAM-dependent methyltransferase